MGDLDKKAHAFLRMCKKRNPHRTSKLMDLILVQHALWIAIRLRRCLGFFNQPVLDDFSGSNKRASTKRPKRTHDRSRQGRRGELQRLASAVSQDASTPEVSQFSK